MSATSLKTPSSASLRRWTGYGRRIVVQEGPLVNTQQRAHDRELLLTDEKQVRRVERF